jgi:hypothetical protein
MAELEQRERAKRAFVSSVRFGLERDAIYELRNSFPNNGRTVIHRSTRPGVVWQVTWLDDAGPVGHSDQQTIEGAAKRAWEDAHPVERARFGA